MDLVTLILGIISVLGTLGTFYFGFKSVRLDRAKRSFEWKDIKNGAIDVLKAAEKTFHPDCLLMMSGPGAIVASIAMVETGRAIPAYLAMLEDRRGPLFKFKPYGHTVISTKKWNIYIPDQLLNEKDKRVMIIDDCVLSGDLQTTVCRFLEENDFPRQNIFLTAVVCSRIAIEANKSPDLYWYLNPHADFYFPWGRWF